MNLNLTFNVSVSVPQGLISALDAIHDYVWEEDEDD